MPQILKFGNTNNYSMFKDINVNVKCKFIVLLIYIFDFYRMLIITYLKNE